MPAKTQDMILLENAFKDIKSRNNVPGAIQSVRRIISRNFDIDFTINIVENDTRNFFGMSIYPSMDMVSQLVTSIMSEKRTTAQLVDMWQKNKQWVLEMDSILLYDSALNANPSEIVAVLLHEVGHVVYSNSIPQRISRLIRYSVMKSTLAIKKLVEWPKVQRLFDLVIVEACSSKNYHYINMHTERVADNFVVKCGYGDALDNFIGKLVSTQGSRLVNRTDNEMENDVKAIINWSLENIAELEFRKTKLRRTLQVELLKNPSEFVKQVVFNIRKTFFGADQDKDIAVTLVSEQYLISGSQRVVKEGVLSLFDKNRKLKKIAQSDIDILSVEVGRIQNEDDKIYCLDLIYDKLDLANMALDLISTGKKELVPQSKDTLTAIKTQLDKMRTAVLNTDIKPKTYGVFIKYPIGYEG